MPALPIPFRRRQPFRPDRQHSLCPDWFALTWDRGRIFDALTPTVGFTTTGTPEIAVSSRGEVGQAVGNNEAWELTSPLEFSLIDRLSMLFVIEGIVDHSGGGFPRVFESSVGGLPWSLTQQATGGNFLIYDHPWSGGMARWTTNEALSSSDRSVVVITYDATSTANDPSIYINGTLATLVEGTAPSGSVITGAATNVFVANRNGYDRAHGGKFVSFWGWRRVLGAAAVRAITENHWQVGAARPRRWLLSPAGAATTVSPGAATHTYTAQAPKVSARVAPAQAVHTYTAQAPKVSARVAPAQVVHTYTAQAPKVSVRVSPATATHTYTGRTPTVLAGNSVSPAPATHVYTGAAPKVSARVAPAAATHTYLGRTPTVLAGNTIAPAQATHAYTAQAPKVSARVAPGAVTHTYTGRTPALATGSRVEPGAATHTYTARTPAVLAAGAVSAPAAQHAYNARTPAVALEVAPPAAVHTYTARTPAVAARVAPGAVTHTYTARVPSFPGSTPPTLPIGKTFKAGRRPTFRATE